MANYNTEVLVGRMVIAMLDLIGRPLHEGTRRRQQQIVQEALYSADQLGADVSVVRAVATALTLDVSGRQ